MKFTFLNCNKSRNEKHGAPAPTGFTEFLWDQKTHLHGTGASTSLKSTAYLFYLHCGEKILLSELLVAGLQTGFALVGSCFPHFSTHKFLTINAFSILGRLFLFERHFSGMFSCSPLLF